jgi:hypothetical protein
MYYISLLKSDLFSVNLLINYCIKNIDSKGMCFFILSQYREWEREILLTSWHVAELSADVGLTVYVILLLLHKA